MRVIYMATRNGKEMLRDPLNVAFGIGFPVIVLLLLTAIQSGIPEAVFPINTIAPGISVFGLSFISLFSGMLVAKDRSSNFLMRSFASPMTAGNFIAAYIIPILPMATAQICITFAFAALLGLSVGVNVLVAVITLLPSALLFTSIGLLAGTLLNDKQVGGICGALLTNLSAWLSGAWFDVKLIGGTFERIAYALPFAHATDAAKAAIANNYSDILPHLLWVVGYAVIITGLAIYAFNWRLRTNEI